ncbi:MAG: PAAR-like domain-containing protein, partial [Pseudomonadota bacterium]
SNGDNPGVATGVASVTVMGPSRPMTGAFSVLLVGMPATRLTSANIQNSTNAPGARIVPSQPKVILLAP